mmetsp:Transcript_20398/g.62001  ORF Transcript_20398/g.62001 Transcript_20398/m.62001 type:complete len:316 (+) Transcript_20398:2301-3248(+)
MVCKIVWRSAWVTHMSPAPVTLWSEDEGNAPALPLHQILLLGALDRGPYPLRRPLKGARGCVVHDHVRQQRAGLDVRPEPDARARRPHARRPAGGRAAAALPLRALGHVGLQLPEPRGAREHEVLALRVQVEADVPSRVVLAQHHVHLEAEARQLERRRRRHLPPHRRAPRRLDQRLPHRGDEVHVPLVVRQVEPGLLRRHAELHDHEALARPPRARLPHHGAPLGQLCLLVRRQLRDAHARRQPRHLRLGLRRRRVHVDVVEGRLDLDVVVHAYEERRHLRVALRLLLAVGVPAPRPGEVAAEGGVVEPRARRG